LLKEIGKNGEGRPVEIRQLIEEVFFNVQLKAWSSFLRKVIGLLICPEGLNCACLVGTGMGPI